MSTTIHVGNLSFSLSEKDLEEYFLKYGKIVDTYIVRRGGRPRGYGFVEFSSSSEADNALAANGEEYSGRAITIELANGKIVKSNFQGNDNNSNDNGGYNNRGYNNNNNGGYNNGGYRNNNNGGYNNGGYNNGGYNNGGYNNGGYRNNNNGGYNNGGYRNNNNGGYNNGGYNNGGYNNGGYRNNSYNNGPRSYQNESGKTFYTLKQNNNGPRRNNNNNNNNNNGPRRNNTRRPESEKEKSVSTVYVSNLPFSYDEKALATLFDGFQVKTAHVVQTRNGRSRGFGFVEFETEEDQLNAIKSKDQTEVDGRTITVKVSLVDKNEQSSQNNDETEQTTQTTTN